MEGGSNSLRDRLKSVWKQTGVMPPALADLVELPSEMEYVWLYFIRLNRRRGSNGFGINPISCNEMLSFFELNSIEYSPQEVELIEMLDNIYLENYSKQQRLQQKNNKGSKR